MGEGKIKSELGRDNVSSKKISWTRKASGWEQGGLRLDLDLQDGKIEGTDCKEGPSEKQSPED